MADEIEKFRSEKYCIVKIFSAELDKTVYPAVPSLWVNDESECFFPSDLKIDRKVKKAIEKCQPSLPGWHLFPAKILTSSDDYGQALRRANRAAESYGDDGAPKQQTVTNLETDTEAKRKRTLNSKYADEIETAAPRLPAKGKKGSRSTEQQQESQQTDEVERERRMNRSPAVERRVSPASKASSPARKASSPARKASSPARKASSPARKSSSPGERALSLLETPPKKTAPSSQRPAKKTAPSKQHSTPVRRASTTSSPESASPTIREQAHVETPKGGSYSYVLKPITTPETPSDISQKALMQRTIKIQMAMERIELQLVRLLRQKEDFGGLVPDEETRAKLPSFPFSDPKDVINFDKRLKKNSETGKQLRAALHTELWRSQGDDGIAMLYCIMKKMFSKSVAMKFVPKGTSYIKGTSELKERFCPLQLYTSVKDAVYARFPETNPQLYEVKLQKFFSGSGDREGGREERRENQLLQKTDNRRKPPLKKGAAGNKSLAEANKADKSGQRRQPTAYLDSSDSSSSSEEV